MDVSVDVAKRNVKLTMRQGAVVATETFNVEDAFLIADAITACARVLEQDKARAIKNSRDMTASGW